MHEHRLADMNKIKLCIQTLLSTHQTKNKNLSYLASLANLLVSTVFAIIVPLNPNRRVM